MRLVKTRSAFSTKSLVVVSSIFVNVGNNNQKQVLHIFFITLYYSIYSIPSYSTAAFFLVVAMNIDISKQFLN